MAMLEFTYGAGCVFVIHYSIFEGHKLLNTWIPILDAALVCPAKLGPYSYNRTAKYPQGGGCVPAVS